MLNSQDKKVPFIFFFFFNLSNCTVNDIFDRPIDAMSICWCLGKYLCSPETHLECGIQIEGTKQKKDMDVLERVQRP